jgi:hypothetical protein
MVHGHARCARLRIAMRTCAGQMFCQTVLWSPGLCIFTLCILPAW